MKKYSHCKRFIEADSGKITNNLFFARKTYNRREKPGLFFLKIGSAPFVFIHS